MRRFQRDLSAARDVRTFEVGAPDAGKRLDVFLAERLRWASRVRVRGFIESGDVSIAGEEARAATPALRLRAGAVVSVGFDATASEPTSDAPQVEVVYEDRWLLAVAKAAGCNVHPTRRHLAGSLLEQVHRRERARPAGERHRDGWLPSPCHRLDRDTSGIVLFTKDPRSRAAIGRQIEERTMRKRYLAWTRGELRGDAGDIDLRIGRDPRSALANRRAICGTGEGQEAKTSWRVIERRGGTTLLELEPVTGRTHQLRVHLAAIGHPILGDALYAAPDGADEWFLRRLEGLPDEEAIRAFGHRRLALHASALALRHPANGEPLELRTAPPADFDPPRPCCGAGVGELPQQEAAALQSSGAPVGPGAGARR